MPSSDTEGSSSSNNTTPKKSNTTARTEENEDESPTQETQMSEKKTRGRPKGSKNKTYTQEQTDLIARNYQYFKNNWETAFKDSKDADFLALVKSRGERSVKDRYSTWLRSLQQNVQGDRQKEQRKRILNSLGPDSEPGAEDEDIAPPSKVKKLTEIETKALEEEKEDTSASVASTELDTNEATNALKNQETIAKEIRRDRILDRIAERNANLNSIRSQQKSHESMDDVKSIAMASMTQSLNASQMMMAKYMTSFLDTSGATQSGAEFNLKNWLKSVLGDIPDLEDIHQAFKNAGFDTKDAVKDLSDVDLNYIETSSVVTITLLLPQRKKLINASKSLK